MTYSYLSLILFPEVYISLFLSPFDRMSNGKLSRELKKGLIELGILALLFRGRKYGLQIIKELDTLSGGFLKIKEGTLYPALHRMEARGLVKSEWEIVVGGIPRKYYVLTEKGRKEYVEVKKTWNTLVESMRSIIGDENE